MSPLIKFPSIFSWTKYLYWAELGRKRFHGLLETFEDSEAIPVPIFSALMSHWLASLWVVIEGWKELTFTDPLIDQLLTNSSYCDLLRRYRNGVFHFQPQLLDSRFTDFLKADPELFTWIEALHLEFLRFLDDWLANLQGTPAELQETRQEVKKLIGWLPEGEIFSEIRRLEKLADDVESKIGSDQSELAEDLRLTITTMRSLTADRRKRLADGYFKMYKEL